MRRPLARGRMPDPLAEDLVRTESDIHNQERNLEGKRQEAASMRAQFDSDIARFRELKKVEAEQNRRARCAADAETSRYRRPELPKPPAPRSLWLNSSTTLSATCTTGTTTSCAMRSNGAIV